MRPGGQPGGWSEDLASGTLTATHSAPLLLGFPVAGCFPVPWTTPADFGERSLNPGFGLEPRDSALQKLDAVFSSVCCWSQL